MPPASAVPLSAVFSTDMVAERTRSIASSAWLFTGSVSFGADTSAVLRTAAWGARSASTSATNVITAAAPSGRSAPPVASAQVSVPSTAVGSSATGAAPSTETAAVPAR